MDGKVNRRVDYLVCALLDLESDYFFAYNQMRMLGRVNKSAVKEEDRHNRGMLISNSSVKVRKCVYQLVTAWLASIGS